MQQQERGKDCGLFAIAFMTLLCVGQDPAKKRFDKKIMHQELLQSFEEDMALFIEKAYSTSRKEDPEILYEWNCPVHCHCRMPDDGNEMVQCIACKSWFQLFQSLERFVQATFEVANRVVSVLLVFPQLLVCVGLHRSQNLCHLPSLVQKGRLAIDPCSLYGSLRDLLLLYLSAVRTTGLPTSERVIGSTSPPRLARGTSLLTSLSSR